MKLKFAPDLVIQVHFLKAFKELLRPVGAFPEALVSQETGQLPHDPTRAAHRVGPASLFGAFNFRKSFQSFQSFQS